MATSASWAADTSIAVAALDASHAAHEACRERVLRTRPALAGHAAFETFSVLTRMPGSLAIDPVTARTAIARAFGEPILLSVPQQLALLRRLGELGVSGGMTYDALVGEAARVHRRTLLTRDRRARATYDLLGVSYDYGEHA